VVPLVDNADVTPEAVSRGFRIVVDLEHTTHLGLRDKDAERPVIRSVGGANRFSFRPATHGPVTAMVGEVECPLVVLPQALVGRGVA
jgi:hypothetical protein